MPLIVAGIDEAGYGPMLGPLCVGMSVIRLDEWVPGDTAPDLWRLLKGGVCRKPADRRRRVAFEDSKKLKCPNDCKARHPLAHLERGVMSFLAWTGADAARPADDADLFRVLGAEVESHPWYAGAAAALPVALAADEIAVAANILHRAGLKAGARPLGLWCALLGESAFNDIVNQTGTKAEATAAAVVTHVRRVWDTFAALEDTCEGGARVVCDRLGGRTRYADLLGRAVPGAAITVLEEAAERCRYLVQGRGTPGSPDDRPRALTVLFMPECESRHLPVAMASMTAKYTRELLMARFNRYWAAVLPLVKPTAGYVPDAWRWLREAGDAITPDLRRRLVRIA